jgi:DNA-binding PadR family transcriptional regulator
LQASPFDKTANAPATQAPVGRTAEEALSTGAWLVLALVIEQASHGYEICQRFQRHFGSFMSMSVPRIYGALDRLRDAGMIEPAVLKPGKPARRQHQMRRSYRATSMGVDAYHRWLAEQMRDDPQRPHLFARIVSAGLLGIDVVMDVIDRYQRECMEELTALGTGSEHLETGGSSLEELTESLVVEQQRQELRARNDWAVHARQALQAYKQRASAEDAGRSGGDMA